jgi:hypothetical protein
MTLEELQAHRAKERAERAANPPVPALTPELVADSQTEISQRAAKAIAYRMLGYDVPSIAREMNETESSVKRHLMAGRRQGVLVDIEDRLQHHAAAIATDQLITLIEAGDKEAVFKTLSGLGHFRTHSSIKSDGPADRTIQLQVNVEMPTGARGNLNTPLTGQITGSPRRVRAARPDTEIDIVPNEVPHAE